MKSSRFDPRAWFSSAWARVPRLRPIGGGEGGREPEGRDQGGPSLGDAKRHLARLAASVLRSWVADRPTDHIRDIDREADVLLADRLVCRWSNDAVTLRDLWMAHDLYAFHGRHDNASAVLWRIRSLLDANNQPPTPSSAAAGPDATAWDPPRSGSVSPSDSNPGAVSPGLERQNLRTRTENGGNSVW